MAKTSYNIQEWTKQGFQNYIAKTKIDAPHTEIVNRAKIESGLNPIIGYERVEVRSLTPIDNEFGPNGETVYVTEKNDPRIRVVGSAVNTATTYGTRPFLDKVGFSFLEITFYGTGLNILLFEGNNISFNAYLDGGVSATNISTSGTSTAIGGRNYRTNVSYKIYEGLTLGWHTVKIENTVANGNFYGFDILNDSSQITIPAGSGFAGNIKQTLESDVVEGYKPAGLSSSGGRVVKYLKDGSVQTVFTNVGTPLYTSNADHTNEEVVRKVNFREFGANRSDDFQSLTGTTADKAFALEDGTTILVGDNVFTTTPSGQETGITLANAIGNSWCITFVGTGLDIQLQGDGSTNYSGNFDLSIDGVNILTNQSAAGIIGNPEKTLKFNICSGLPYGTHTVRWRVSATGSNHITVSDFYIYQPKKPSIPSDAVELVDYNVLADVIPNTLVSAYSIGQGMIYKSASREISYINTNWNGRVGIDARNAFGIGSSSTVNGAAVEYSFFGTGFEYRAYNSGDGALCQITIDGINATSTNFPTATATSNGLTFDFNTGQTNEDTAAGLPGGNTVSITGLPLKQYTVRVTNIEGGADGVQRFWGFAIATPIHINRQSLKLGNSCIVTNDNVLPLTNDKSIDDKGIAKAFLRFDQANNDTLNSKNIAAIIDLGVGYNMVFFETPFEDEPITVASALAEQTKVFRSSTIPPQVAVLVLCENSGGTDIDSTFSLACFGKLVDEE